MSTVVDDLIRDRISFLVEQIRSQNKQEEGQTLRLQAEILQTADLNKLDAAIRIRRNHLKQSTSTKEVDRLFVELEALERLQRQVKRSKSQTRKQTIFNYFDA